MEKYFFRWKRDGQFGYQYAVRQDGTTPDPDKGWKEVAHPRPENHSPPEVIWFPSEYKIARVKEAPHEYDTEGWWLRIRAYHNTLNHEPHSSLTLFTMSNNYEPPLDPGMIPLPDLPSPISAIKRRTFPNVLSGYETFFPRLISWSTEAKRPEGLKGDYPPGYFKFN